MPKLRHYTVLTWTLFLILLLVQSACTNLSAVRDFAKVSADSAQYTALVDNYGLFAKFEASVNTLEIKG